MIAQRLASLRQLMAERGYDALLIPRADEYLGEYIPERNERLRWASGFTGSAGMLLVMADTAALFIDGRYTVQVQQQCDPVLFAFHHLLEEPLAQVLAAQLAAGARVACDPRLHSQQWFTATTAALAAHKLELVADADNLVDACWHDRPDPAPGAAMLLPEAFTGQGSAAKRRRIGEAIGASGADAALIFAPDSVSWLFNLRGSQMPQLPVVLGFALLDSSGDAILFTDAERLPADFSAHVGAGVAVHAEAEAAAVFAQYHNRKVIIDPGGASAAMHDQLRQAGAQLIAASDPVALPKACKNSAELAGTRAAHVRDAVAVIRFLAWLDAEVADARLHNEAELADRLFALRAEGERFHALSFDTISAAGSNAAMCHYNHRNGEPAALAVNSVYLCDSGGQYLDGTTDITRTVAIGDPGEDVRRLFTLVLKGHIALARARFPMGTTGMQLDTLARQFLWREGFDFDHGTGHGVGVFLSVHEGPQRISKTGDVALRPGMIVSNEPGYYRDGCFGMRCENLQVVVLHAQEEHETPMQGFETLSLVPFDTRLLDRRLLTAVELAWLNDYHRRVRQEVGPLVPAIERAWLDRATQHIEA